jgi:hypothetical protein
MLTAGLHVASTRWAAGGVGCVLGALGLAAMLLRLGASSPQVVALAVCASLWLVWVTVDFALTPLDAV